jgi:mRNA-degrading endonuclease toxin of MazEF toxin-antitoxin module
MTKGDIVVVEFPFTDLISTKLRPSLILLENRFDYVICFITSNLKIKEPYDMVLPSTNANGLKKESLLKTNKIMTIDKIHVKGKIGQLTNTEMNLLNKNITKLFRL